jgi:hypothetical protein
MGTDIFELDVSGIDRFERKILEKAGKIAFPLAVKGTLNTLAFESRKKSQTTIRQDFLLRNKFTENSVRVEPVKTLKITDMISTVGSIAPYMEKQEEGATERSSGKHGLRIPTGAAAGQTQLFPRRGVIKKKFRRGQIRLANRAGRIKAKNRRQFNLMSIRVAALRGQSPFVFLPFGGGQAGLYKIIPQGSAPPTRYKRGRTSFNRSFKWGRPKGKPGKEKLILIHSFAKKTITIPETRWLGKNVEKVADTMAVIFKNEADRIFDRLVK